MSARPKSLAGRLTDLLSLALLLAVLYACRFAPRMGDAAVLCALGFLVLAGTLLAEILEVIKLPHLTGYLLAGLIAGPHVLQLIDADSVKRLGPVNTLALALIALGGGAELRTEQLRRGLKSLLVATVVQNIVVILGVGSIFILARPIIPFLAPLPFTGVVGVALLWAVTATTRSPSTALGILAQTHAKGPLARFSLAFVMLSDVTVIVLLATGIMIARGLLEPGATLSFQSFHVLGHEILGSVAIGTTLGLLLAAYMRAVGGQLVIVLVAVSFGASEVLRYLQFEPLLTFLVAGFVVQNLSKQGDRFVHTIDEIGAVVYVVFFAIAGADLDIPLLRKLWPIALLLAASRSIVTFVAAKIASKIARDEPSLRKWSWSPLIAQAGLTQGLANIIEREFPLFGSPFRALVFANVALNAIVGPIVFKFALDRLKESKAPVPSLPDTTDGSETSEEVA